MASFKNKIDIKKTRRFLTLKSSALKFYRAKPSLSFTERCIPSFCVTPREDISSHFYGKEEKFDKKIDFHPSFDTGTDESLCRSSRKHSNLYPKSKKNSLFSENEIRISKQRTLFIKRYDPFLKGFPAQIEDLHSFCTAKPTNNPNDAHSYLQIFFHCNLEKLPQLSLESEIEARKPAGINAYLRKKYKPFLFKSLTQRSQSINHICTISKASSKFSLSKKIFWLSYPGRVLLMRLNFLTSCAALTKVYAETPKSLSNAKTLHRAKLNDQDVEKFRVNRAKKGNHFVIVLKKNSFWLLQRLVKDQTISILGGIYGETPISIKAILALTKEIEEDTLYYRSVSSLKEKPAFFLSALNNIYSRLCFTVCLFKNYKHRVERPCTQLSESALSENESKTA